MNDAHQTHPAAQKTQRCTPTEPLWTRRQAADWLGVSESSLAMDAVDRRWGVPFIKLGRTVRYHPEHVREWAAGRPQDSLRGKTDDQSPRSPVQAAVSE